MENGDQNYHDGESREMFFDSFKSKKRRYWCTYNVKRCVIYFVSYMDLFFVWYAKDKKLNQMNIHPQ